MKPELVKAMVDGKILVSSEGETAFYDPIRYPEYPFRYGSVRGQLNYVLHTIWEGIDWKIKETISRPMLPEEVQYIVTTPHCVIRFLESEPFISSFPSDETCAKNPFTFENLLVDLTHYSYAIIDSHGKPIDGWKKFIIEEEK
jgi:hypothetical protein